MFACSSWSPKRICMSDRWGLHTRSFSFVGVVAFIIANGSQDKLTWWCCIFRDSKSAIECTNIGLNLTRRIVLWGHHHVYSWWISLDASSDKAWTVDSRCTRERRFFRFFSINVFFDHIIFQIICIQIELHSRRQWQWIAELLRLLKIYSLVLDQICRWPSFIPMFLWNQVIWCSNGDRLRETFRKEESILLLDSRVHKSKPFTFTTQSGKPCIELDYWLRFVRRIEVFILVVISDLF